MEHNINFENITLLLDEYKKENNPKVSNHLRDLVFSSCFPLVKKIANSLARRSTDPIDDITQVGSLGLIKAIEFYNPDLSKNFKAYATYLITGEIKHYLRDKISMIKVPREYYELAYRISQIIQQFKNRNNQLPSDLEIAKELQVPIKKVKTAIEVERRKQAISLEEIYLESKSNAWQDKVLDENYERLQDLKEKNIMLTSAINRLPEDLKNIILLNFFEDLSQKDISQILNISQMQVSRKIKKALNELFKIMSDKEARKG